MSVRLADASVQHLFNSVDVASFRHANQHGHDFLQIIVAHLLKQNRPQLRNSLVMRIAPAKRIVFVEAPISGSTVKFRC